MILLSLEVSVFASCRNLSFLKAWKDKHISNVLKRMAQETYNSHNVRHCSKRRLYAQTVDVS